MSNKGHPSEKNIEEAGLPQTEGKRMSIFERDLAEADAQIAILLAQQEEARAELEDARHGYNTVLVELTAKRVYRSVLLKLLSPEGP